MPRSLHGEHHFIKPEYFLPKKCILIILDGLGDRSYECFGHQTPLQAAWTPVLDRLAAMGANGLFHATILGEALPSESAHFVMFGYELQEFPGRGILEGLGAGIDLGPRDVAVLAHFVGVHEENGCLVLDKGQPNASVSEAAALIDAVAKYEKGGVSIRFTPTKGLSGILMLRGNVAPQVTDTDPMREGCLLSEVKAWYEYAGEPNVRNTAETLKAYLLWTYHCLRSHPVNLARIKEGKLSINCLVTQRAGRLKSITSFRERYGLRGLSIASGIIYQGLSAYLGLDFKKVTDTQDPAHDIAERLSIALHMLDDYDFIHVHTKVPDEAAHTKDPRKKMAVIEALDRGIGRTIDHFTNNPEVLLIITSDHSTPSSGPLIHSGEPLPLTFCGAGMRRDDVRQFNEVSVAAGALGCVRGKELMCLLLNHLDRIKLRGIMDTPVDQLFWPGDYEPFNVSRKTD